MTRTRRIAPASGLAALVALSLAFLPGCALLDRLRDGAPDFRLLASPETRFLEDDVRSYFAGQGRSVEIEYAGSPRIAATVRDGGSAYDAVWPAERSWLLLAGADAVADSRSVMRTPVVLALRESTARRMRWGPASETDAADVLAAAESGEVSLACADASFTDVGYWPYLAMLAAACDGEPAREDLGDPDVQERMRAVLGRLDRSATSSAGLTVRFVRGFDRLDGLVQYEALLPRERMAEELVIVPLEEGLAVADFPLALLPGADAEEERLYEGLLEHLRGMGDRVVSAGFEPASAVSTQTASPAWRAMPVPAAPAMDASLVLYRSLTRKPAVTVYCLDFSGSMQALAPGAEDTGEGELKSAMRSLLTADESRRLMMPPQPGDITIVIPFDEVLREAAAVRGADSGQLERLVRSIEDQTPGGGTDVYSPLMEAYRYCAGIEGLESYSAAVILVTDGRSDTGATVAQLKDEGAVRKLKSTVPVYAIRFGAADSRQLTEIARYTNGRVFDGRDGLMRAFVEAKRMQ